MWHGYGKNPSSNEGIFMSIEESFPTVTTAQRQQARETEGSSNQSRFDTVPTPLNTGNYMRPDGEVVGSLIDVCGFQTGTSKLGEVASETKVSEAVIMIPFVKTSIDGQTTERIKHNVFEISNEMFQLQKTNIEQGKPAIPGVPNQAAIARAGEGSSNQSRFENAAISPDIQETSISRMIKLMKKYYIPPELDFLTYNNQTPFVMYIFEFNHTFDQQDLSDIWQGVLPKIGTKARRSDSEDDNEIIHNMGPYDFFEGRQLPNDTNSIRWLTFKVKQKGEKNYYNITADSRDDNRFKFDFNVGKQTPDYSYNWPYDFFSLVELANIEGGIIIEGPTEAEKTEKYNRREDERERRRGSTATTETTTPTTTPLNFQNWLAGFGFGGGSNNGSGRPK
jgi:hypothetical protein